MENGPGEKQKSKPRIASAKRRVKPLARLLRCATALQVTPLPSATAQMAARAERFPSGPQHPFLNPGGPPDHATYPRTGP